MLKKGGIFYQFHFQEISKNFVFPFYFFIFIKNQRRFFLWLFYSFRGNYILEQPLVVTGCSNIRFYNLSCFPRTVSECTLGNPLLTVQHLSDPRDVMPFHWSLIASRPSPCLINQRVSPGVEVSQECASTQILSLFLTKRYHLRYFI